VDIVAIVLGVLVFAALLALIDAVERV